MDDLDDFGDLYGDLDCGNKEEESKIEIEEEPIRAESNERLNLEEENGGYSYSDSEDDDDFCIVLNEVGGIKAPPSSNSVAGGFDGEDGDLNGDQVLVAAMEASELAQGNEEKGAVRNCSGGSQRLNLQAGSHLSNSARLSIPGRGGAWDNPLMPCFQSAASHSQVISATAQTGGTFCLPRNRTIFDVNIDVFEQKPWRHNGADITDYFNFGLNEESWKSYWELLDTMRKQPTMLRFPVYQSSRSNQAERKVSFAERLEKGQKESDTTFSAAQPKGRAIQVEGSLGERIPSTEIRRPRVQDSDVVIKINMEGSSHKAPAFCKKSLEHPEASELNSGNDSNERGLSSHSDSPVCRGITDPFEQYFPDADGSKFRGTCAKSKSNIDCKSNDSENHQKTDSREVPHQYSSSNLQSPFKESKDAFCMGIEFMHAKETPVEELKDSIDSYLSYDSISGATESEQEDSKGDVHEHDLSGEDKQCSRTRLKSVAERYVANDDEQTSSLEKKEKKHQKMLDSGQKMSRTRERKFCSDIDDARRKLYDREPEGSQSYKSRRHAANYANRRSFNVHYLKGDSVSHFNRDWNDEDCLEQRGCNLFERLHEEQGRRRSLHMHTDHRIVKSKSFFKEKNSFLQTTTEKDNVHWMKMNPYCDDMIHDHRYEGHALQDVHGRLADFYDIEENFDLKFHKRVYPTDRELRSPKRSRHNRELSYENRSSRYIEDDIDHYLNPQRNNEPLNTDERDWHDTLSPREPLCISWRRSNGRSVNHKGGRYIRGLQFKNKTNGHSVAFRENHYLSYEGGVDSDVEEFISEYPENTISEIQMRRCRHLSMQNYHTDDDERFRNFRKVHRSLEHDNLQVRRPILNHHRSVGGRSLDTARNVRVVGRCDPDIKNDVSIILDSEASRELEAVGCRQAVKHLNGVKGKLASRSSRVARRNEDFSARHRKNHLKNSKKLKEYKQEEVRPHSGKGEDCRNHQTESKMDKVKGYKSVDSGANPSLDKCLLPVNVEYNDIEDGELIEDPEKNDVVSITKDCNSGKMAGNIVGTYDNSRILETIAKMERRRERFKEPIAAKQEIENIVGSSLLVNVSAVSDDIKQQRPARKRRWGGN